MFELAVGDGTPRKALLTALVVGTLLTVINHGDSILLDGMWPPAAKPLLTFVVPYCVATWGAVTAKRTHWQRAQCRERQAARAGDDTGSGNRPAAR